MMFKKKTTVRFKRRPSERIVEFRDVDKTPKELAKDVVAEWDKRTREKTVPESLLQSARDSKSDLNAEILNNPKKKKHQVEHHLPNVLHQDLGGVANLLKVHILTFAFPQVEQRGDRVLQIEELQLAYGDNVLVECGQDHWELDRIETHMHNDLGAMHKAP